MSSPDEDLLQRALTGDLDPRGAEWARLCAERPTLAARWAELNALVNTIGELADDERGLLEAPLPTATERDRDQLRATLSKAYPATARARAWRRNAFLAAAAVALAIVGAALWQGRSESPRKPEFMGGPHDSIISDLERSGPEFRWKCSAPADQFSVRFYAAKGGERSSTPFVSRTVLEQTWLTLSEQDAAQLTAEFVWEVSAYRLGELMGSAQRSEAP